MAKMRTKENTQTQSQKMLSGGLSLDELAEIQGPKTYIEDAGSFLTDEEHDEFLRITHEIQQEHSYAR